MQTRKVRPSEEFDARPRPYCRLSLVDLAEKITQGDRLALHEFHDHRPVFRYGAGGPLRFAEYLGLLRRGKTASMACNGDEELLDRAYDLTMDKFSNLPSNRGNGCSAVPETSPTRGRGSDCRNQYRAFLERFHRDTSVDPPASQLEHEVRAAKTLQRLVRHHFLLSCGHVRQRSKGLERQYVWKTGGGTLYIRMPSDMTGPQCGAWLRANIGDSDARRSGERERVQEIVYQRLNRRRLLQLSAVDDRRDWIPAARESARGSNPDGLSVGGLADVVAREKARNIDGLRPGIRTLGPKRLKALIRRIFDDLHHGDYKDGQIARDFGLSKATFSRFAGSRWSRDRMNTVGIPDLWVNTAHTLTGHAAFAEVARETGVWTVVQAIRGTSDPVQEGADE